MHVCMELYVIVYMCVLCVAVPVFTHAFYGIRLRQLGIKLDTTAYIGNVTRADRCLYNSHLGFYGFLFLFFRFLPKGIGRLVRRVYIV